MPTDAICDGHEETEHGINCARSETTQDETAKSGTFFDASKG